jgi:hypothetical protein
MSKQKTQRPRFMVGVHESVQEPDTLTFTFVPKDPTSEEGEGGQRKAQYVVDVREQEGQLAFNWRGRSPDALRRFPCSAGSGMSNGRFSVFGK